MPFSCINGADLFYTDVAGPGSPVLFVHGWACDSHDWSCQLGPFAAAGHRVIALDNRGHGRSEVVADGYDVPQLARDAAALIEQLGAQPAIAIGHSLGAFIVSVLAVEHPDHVRAIVAVDPGYGAPDSHLADTAAGLITALRTPAGLDQIAEVFSAMEGPVTPQALRVWHGRRAQGGSPLALTGALKGIFELPPGIGSRAEADAYLPQRRCPVLGIHTRPTQAAWEETTMRHPGSRVVTMSGTGHWVHQERPDEFNALVLEWIDQLPH